jgi:hypothetical protein
MTIETTETYEMPVFDEEMALDEEAMSLCLALVESGMSLPQLRAYVQGKKEVN